MTANTPALGYKKKLILTSTSLKHQQQQSRQQIASALFISGCVRLNIYHPCVVSVDV